MRKKLLLTAMSVVALCASGATFRVNNTAGSGALYTTYAAAEAAASDGDVIIFDGSSTSYGDIEVYKKVTLQGPGYFLSENGITSEGNSEAKFNSITVKGSAKGAKLTGLYVDGRINLNADEVIVTRCRVTVISHVPEYSFTDDHLTGCVIHQNYISGGIWGDSYSAPSTFFQVTNNIFPSNNNLHLQKLDQAVISHNTIVSYEPSGGAITNSKVEYNIVYGLSRWGDSNSYKDNYSTDALSTDILKDPYYGYNPKDMKVKEVDARLTTTQGAFSGDDPYVLSGQTTGPSILDVVVPQSVVKGEDLNVTVKIGMSR